MRIHFIPRAVALLPKVKPLLRYAFRTIAQIGLHYRSSPLSASAGLFPPRAPRPGDRLPWVIFGEGGRPVDLHDLVRAPAFHLLLFAGAGAELQVDALRRLADRTGGVVQIEVIPRTDHTREVYRVFGIQTHGCYLVRPDMYIAYRSRRLDARPLENYLAQIALNV
jgi:hypothetical protein